MVAVPSPLSVRLTPVGRFPDSVIGRNRVAADVVTAKRPRGSRREGGAVTRGDARGFVHGQGEGLAGVRADPVARRESEVVDATVARVGRPRQCGRAVTVVGEGHTAWQGAGLVQAAAGLPTVVNRVKLPAAPTVKVVSAADVIVGACGPLLDGQGEGLVRVRTHTVGRRDGDREILGDLGRDPGQSGSPVPVVGEGHAVGQVARLGQGRGREARSRSR